MWIAVKRSNLANAGFEQAANQLNAQLGTNTSVANMQAGTQAGMQSASQPIRWRWPMRRRRTKRSRTIRTCPIQGSQADADRFLRAVAQQEAGGCDRFPEPRLAASTR